jgi:hypothetical protein
MELSQMELIKEQVFLNMRETITEALLEHNIIQRHNNQAGWWAMTPSGPVWVSIYEILEEARD